MCTVDYRFGHGHHFWYVLEQRCPGAFAGHCLYRTAVIYIYEIRVYLGSNFGCFTHAFYIASKKLDTNGTFISEYIKLLPAFSGIAYQTFRRDELRIHQVGAISFAYRTEWRIADILHRSKQ